MIKKLIQGVLAASARRAINRDKPTVVAITGSLGKSSTKEAVAVALGARDAGSGVRATQKNYNNEYGVPFTILDVKAPGRDPVKWLAVLWKALWVGWGFGRVNAKVLVLEMGADHKGDLAHLVSIARPDIAVVTSVAPAHTEFFGTLEEVAEEKATLVRSLKKNGVAILNNDDPRVTSMRKDFKGEAVYYGESEGSDVRVHQVSIEVEEGTKYGAVPRGVTVFIETDGKQLVTHLQGTIGSPQAAATAAALAVADHFDILPETAIDRLQRDYHGIPGRTRIIPGIKYTTIIDDSYNAASSQAVLSAIRDLAAIPLGGKQRRIAALGDMRELGTYSEEAHRSVGREAFSAGIDELVTCGTLAATIAGAAEEAGMEKNHIHRFDSSEDGGRFLQDLVKPGDVILVKGSQGSRMEKIVKELMAEPLQAPFLLVRMTADWMN